MIHLHKKKYEYLEEVNEGILRQFAPAVDVGEESVLDVGCGSGALSEAIQKKGYSVWGIEAYAPAAEIAAKRITKVITADLTDISAIKRAIGDRKFDHIIFSDVLEHLYDPFTILKEYLTLLKTDGHILISVPNAAVWTNRLKLLFGVFNYADTGVMDRTHIRFFTYRTARELVEAAGCSVVKVDHTPYFVRAALPLIKRVMAKDNDDRREIIDSPLYKMYMKFIYPIEYFIARLRRQLFAFRIIIIGKKT
jgi:2-polyprenyl-3-methyl-5-hydroxy-6-metoxy-1,4-benzoquinol methylase